MAKLTGKNVCGSNFSYQHHHFDTFLNDMLDLDLRTIELWGVAPHLDIAAIENDEVTVITRKLAEREMKVICLTPEQVVYPINIASGDAAFRERSINLFKRAAEICQQLGCPYLFVTSGRGYEDEPIEEGWKRSAEALSVIGDYAARLGVPCLFEPLQRTETNLVRTLEDMSRMMSDVASNNFRIVLDSVAMASAGDTVVGYFKAFPGRIAHVHLIDGSPSGHLAWGDGNLPLKQYVAELQKEDYDGYITFEIFGNGTYALRPRSAVEQCLSAFDKVLAELAGR